MKVLLVILRVIVFLVAFIGAAGSIILVVRWRDQAMDSRENVDLARQIGKELGQAMSPAEKAKFDNDVARLERTTRAIPFLLLGGVLGLVGGILALLGRTGSASVWFITGGIGPAVFQPAVLCFTFGLFLAGMLSLLAWLLTFADSPQPARR